MSDGQSTEPDVASTILRSLERTSPRFIVALRPTVIDGRIVDGEVVWFTERARQMNPSFAVGRGITDSLVDRSPSDVTVRACMEALEHPGVTVVRGPYQVQRRDGTADLRLSVVAVDDLLVIEYEDLTELLEHARAASASEHNFHELLDGLDAGVVLLHPFVQPDGSFVDAELVWSNEASKRMWINQEGLAVGTKVATVYYDLDDWLVAANQAWRGNPTTRMLTVDPSVAPGRSATETLRRVGDTLVELTIDRTNDQLLLDSLAEMDHRFAALVDDLPLTVLVARLDADEFEFVSPNASTLMGRPLHELRSITQWSALVHADDRPANAEVIRNIAKSGQHEGTIRYDRPDGTTFTASLRIVRRKSPSGTEGFIALITDISEQQRMLERLATGERLETLGRTAGQIAHDFTNLLMIVSGNIDRARRQLGESMALDTAAVAAHRAADLSTSLLSFARGRHGVPRRLGVDQFLRNFEPILHGIVHPHAVLQRDFADAHLAVWADEAHLQQILLNLVTNARDASPAGGTVHITAAPVQAAHCHLLDEPGPGPYVAIAVHDDGPGVPTQIAAKIWEPFFSGKHLTERSGTGLGLSTVHGLAHQHGGHVRMDSTAGGGTTFTVYLPLPGADE